MRIAILRKVLNISPFPPNKVIGGVVIISEPKVAYLSAEIAFDQDKPTYSGGLGVLSGDSIRAAADIGLPMVAVSLLYRNGYFTQKIIDGRQVEHYPVYNPEEDLLLLPGTVSVPIENRNVKLQAWQTNIQGRKSRVKIILLDSDLPENAEWDRGLTSRLYGGSHPYHRLTQEFILGAGSVRMLEKQGYSPALYHLNEGHGAFAALELMKRHGREKTRDMIVFTTHTPVPAGHDSFDYSLADQVLGCSGKSHYLPGNICELAGQDCLNMTLLALNMSCFANAVSRRHAEITREMFPGYEIHSITNGIHSETWISEHMQALLDKTVSGWRSDLMLLSNGSLDKESVHAAHLLAKRDLLSYINRHSDAEFQEDVLTLGFARRFATYKRGDLIFRDIERLALLGANRLQIVFGGKAHPNDAEAKKILEGALRACSGLEGRVKTAFVENHDMTTGRLLVSGSDIWVNTPRRPFEASGTSGMKAAANARANLSTYDGWWCEASGGGWTIGPKTGDCNDAEDADSLYDILERDVIPGFNNGGLFNKGLDGLRDHPNFSAERMMREYASKAYRL